MSRYRKVEVCLWANESFRALSPIKPSGQSLYLYLLTGPHTGPIPGLSLASRMALIEALRWTSRSFNLAFAELESANFARADWPHQVLWLPGVIEGNVPTSPKIITSWREEFKIFPACDVKNSAVDEFHRVFHKLGVPHLVAFKELRLDSDSAREQEQKQDQYQEREQDRQQQQQQEGSPTASQDHSVQITDERWQIAQKAGFTDRAWIEQETSKFNLKGRSFAARYPTVENAWLMWLTRGKEYAEKHPNVVPITTPQRRSKMFFAEG